VQGPVFLFPLAPNKTFGFKNSRYQMAYNKQAYCQTAYRHVGKTLLLNPTAQIVFQNFSRASRSHSVSMKYLLSRSMKVT